MRAALFISITFAVAAGVIDLYIHRLPITILIGELTAIFLLIVGSIYANPHKYHSLHIYMDFIFGEIPSLLQIITFAGFLAILFKNSQVSSVTTITLVVIVLNNLYLNNKEHKFIAALKIDQASKSTLAKNFLLFNYVLTTLLLILFLSTTKYLLRAS